MKVVKRKLGKEKVWGLADTDNNTIEIDVRLNGKRLLLYYIHEALHILEPTWSETKIKKQASRLTAVLWKEKYRRVDVHT